MTELFKSQEPMDVANFVIDLAKKQGNPITNLKLQKVLFFLQGFCLDKYNAPLIDGEFSKWKYGPVEEEVYQEFKSNGSSPIVSMVPSYSFDKNGNINIFDPTKMNENSFENRSIFTKIADFVKQLFNIEPWRLVEITHKHSSWHNYEKKIMTYSADNYSQDEILDCFKESYEKLGI